MSTRLVTLFCEPHQQPARYVVVHLEAVPHDPDGFDPYERLACSPTCCDPLWSGERWLWLPLTPERAEDITGLEMRAAS